MTSPINLPELRAMAEAVEKIGESLRALPLRSVAFHDARNEHTRAEGELRKALSPDVVLRMIEIAERAQDVVDRWDTPLWKNVNPTAETIGWLRKALAELRGTQE